MKTQFIVIILLPWFLIISADSFSQCEIKERVDPDGMMYYYIDPVVFYWTKTRELKGNVVTDKEHYFLGLQPSPFPEKPEGKKLKDNLELKLANNKVYQLSHFDTRYIRKDTVLRMTYLIDEKDLKDLLSFDATEARINMNDSTGLRIYVFKLHKSAIREQLECFLKEEEDKKK
jgi:hypothetical protein